jgi:HK97 family phage major capsid protein
LGSNELDSRAEALRAEIMELAEELTDKSDMPADRVDAIEQEITTKSAQLDKLEADKRAQTLDEQVKSLEDRMKAFSREKASAKAQAILKGGIGSNAEPAMKSVGPYNEVNWLSALVNKRNGDTDAQEFVKAVLGTSVATGTAIVPNNFVSSLVTALAANNIYRELFNVVDGVQGAGVDIPYEITAISAALQQGAYGSNKDVRDFQFARATATLYTIAQIADVSNQLLRQSNGQAEAAARRRLAKSIAALEATYITNGTGSSQPLGFFQAFLAFGDPLGFKTTLSSESRAGAIGRGISALEARGIIASESNLCVVMHPTDYWEMATETLGTSGSGGWAFDPAAGAAGSPPGPTVWGVPVRRDPYWPAAQIGTALIIERSEVDIYVGDGFRIDVSDAGNRFDQNVTGFRAEEEFGFNAEPYVRSGRVQKVLGL